jgi:tetratricopeptide (TPR) repeat protein
MMKRLILISIFCFALTSVFAQEAVELKNAGNEALKTKDYAKALENYEKAFAVWGDQPQDFPTIYNAGVCAFNLKDYPKSFKYFDQAIAGNYKVEMAYRYKATGYKAQNNTEAYLATLNEGIAKSPENSQLKDMLAKYYQVEGTANYNSAAAILKAAADKVAAGKMKTTDPAYKAETDKAKKEFNEAIELINKALEIKPADETSKKIKSACEQNIKALQ